MISEAQLRAWLAQYEEKARNATTEFDRDFFRGCASVCNRLLAGTPDSVTVTFSDKPFTWPSDVPDPTRTSLTDGRFDRDTDEE